MSSAYFAWSTELDLVWVSDPRARHSRNLRSNRSAAVAVCDSNQAWGGPDRGIQLFGVAGEVEAAAVPRAEELYRQRFSAYRADELGGYRLYRFRPQRLKLFDERELGAGVFVTATVLRAGRLRWKRTEVYRASPPEPSPPG